MKIRSYVLSLVSMLICTACFDPTFALRWDKEFSKSRIVIVPWVDRLEGLGFDIYLRPDDAKKVQAPNGAEFHELLEKKLLQEEQVNGRKLCRLGYKLGSTVNNYHGVYALVSAECKTEN